MTYRGHIQQGAVVLDQQISLPDGIEVRCVVIPMGEDVGVPEQHEGMYNDLLKFAGIVKDTPSDGSAQHDHYLYGNPKR